MMRQIRPYKMFTLLREPPVERIANVVIPSRRGFGGTSILETFLIITGARIVDARKIFEFGTFLGSNTYNMALNTRDDVTIFTLDLDDHSREDLNQHPEDASLTNLHLASSSLDFAGAPVEKKIKCLTGDSTRFDFSPWKQSIDLSFIDGGHDLVTVRSDSENAFEMAIVGKPSCIFWHDYHNIQYPELTDFLDELGSERNIFHIAETMLCVWFNDPTQSILPQLLS